MSSLMDLGHVAQLHEIQKARLKRDEPGIATEVEALIKRLTDGGVAGTRKGGRIFNSELPGIRAEEQRRIQAKRLWDKGFGDVIGCESFEQYLETIPEIPERPQDLPEHFKLILVDARIARDNNLGGLVAVCELLGVTFSGNTNTLVSHDPKHKVKEDVYWMWCQDGKQNCNKSVKTCRKQFAKSGEIGLNAMEGLAIFAQNPDVLKDHCIDLPSSVRSGGREGCAQLRLWRDRPGLRCCWGGNAYPDFGSASRREC